MSKSILIPVYCACHVLIVSMTSGCAAAGKTVTMEHIGHQAETPVSGSAPADMQSLRGYVEHTYKQGRKAYLVPTIEDEATGSAVACVDIEMITVKTSSRSVPERGGSVTLDFAVTLPKSVLGSSRGVEVTPTLHLGETKTRLRPVVIRGRMFDRLQRRNSWYSLRRKLPGRRCDSLFDGNARLDSVTSAGHSITYHYSQKAEERSAGGKALVTLSGRVVSLGGTVRGFSVSDTLTFNVSSLAGLADTSERSDTLYMRGVNLLKERRYAQALMILEGYADRNTALCLLSLGNDDRALDILVTLPHHPVHDYLTAIACARSGMREQARAHLDAACASDPDLRYRARLDPELHDIGDMFNSGQ
jgi:hypothetical protein